MTSRIHQPDTEADIQLRSHLSERPLKNFLVIAGAGSGKTTSLVKALDHVERTAGAMLRRSAQQVACITYTDVATTEILNDVGRSDLFHVSTIHSFLWSVIRPFQDNIRDLVVERIEEKIRKSEEKSNKPKTTDATREKLQLEIADYEKQIKGVRSSSLRYGVGRDYEKGILGHADVLRFGPEMISRHSLLQDVLAGRFPYLLIDESQDTSPDFVESIHAVVHTVADRICIGFFGDPMQKIYLAGIGDLEVSNEWNVIQKPENFRCPASVLSVINAIRSEVDGLVQNIGSDQQAQIGSARVFLIPRHLDRTSQLSEIRDRLARLNKDDEWMNDRAVRILVLVHRAAANRLGFPTIYSALNDNGPNRLKDGLLDGSAWVFKPFFNFVLPITEARAANDDFEVISVLRRECPRLSPDNIKGQDPQELLGSLKEDVEKLCQIFHGDSKLRDVLMFLRNSDMVMLDDRFGDRLDSGNDGNVLRGEDKAVNDFLETNTSELIGFRDYISEKSPFSTQQGVKGAEFERVLVVLDDAESNYNQFSYDKLLGVKPLSDRDKEHIAAKEDSVIDRTRRLFYVCCSRATKDLAVAFFTDDIGAAKQQLKSKGWFEEDKIYSCPLEPLPDPICEPISEVQLRLFDTNV